jgi:thiosulfate/3-mercaptopyruvate sulfurtransferase
MSSPLVSVTELARMLSDASSDASGPVLLDVRWELGPPPRPAPASSSRELYEEGHIPGAVFVDLDRELASAPGSGGRHPLPAAEAFTRSMRAAGVHEDRPVVVYDAQTSMAAARAWWLLRYFGHRDTRVLDGGLAAWARWGGNLASGDETAQSGDFVARPGAMAVLDASAAAALAYGGVLLDARAAERFAGESEPLDPVAGHIPGARNRPTNLNLRPSGEFRDAASLRTDFERLGAGGSGSVGAYCGSGVTAAHEVLALEVAGVPAALYPGSWSEWITDPTRPIATGEDPGQAS